MNNISKKIFLTATLVICCVLNVLPQNSRTPQEEDYYRILTLPVPEGILLEVGGVATLPDGRIAVCTRRGDVWTVENPTMENGDVPRYSLFASGLHEALGLLYHDGSGKTER